MKKRVKRKLPVLFLACLILLGSGAFLLFSSQANSKEAKDINPTLFIHGFNGSENSFGRLIERFEEHQWADKSLVVHVSANGRLSIRGSFSKKQNPMVHVMFADNQASIARQTTWISSVLQTLSNTHQIQQVNLVGHSMGGLASASYLLNNQDTPSPQVKKLITIGSPFSGIERERYAIAPEGSGAHDLQWQSPALRLMEQKHDLFDEQTLVLNIAGVIEDDTTGSDGLVSLESARNLKGFVQDGNYSEKIFYNPAATHTGLHELKAIDKAIARFLWDID